MSPEQKQSEMSKVQGLSQEQIAQYLTNMGINQEMLANIMKGGSHPNPQQGFGRKFNY